MDTNTFLAGLPKAELHVHLEGTLEPSLIKRLAERNGVDIEIDEEKGFTFTDLTSFLAVYYPNMTVLQTEQDFFELAWEYLEKAHSQNVLHTEMFFDPQAHTSRGVPFPTVIGGYRRAIVTAQRELGISADLILCFLRDFSPEYAMATLMESLPYKEWIVGVGLDSDERDNPPALFAEVFARARAEGYFLTMHCDIDQNNSIEHIRQVIEDIGVDRIDHGTNIVEDERLVALVREKGIGLTSCPVSNSFVTEDMKSAEVVTLLRAGVKVMLNSDDPAYFGAYLTENMVAIADATDLTRAELVQLQRNAFEISWLSSSARDGFLQKLDEYEAANA
jgi:adenine deaminase